MSDVHLTGTLPPLSELEKTKPVKVPGSGDLNGHRVDIEPPLKLIDSSSDGDEHIQLNHHKPIEERDVEHVEPGFKLARWARYGALPTEQQFIDRAGKPKEDIDLGIFGKWRMSTGYKRILTALAMYETGFEEAKLDTVRGTDRKRVLTYLRVMLQDLRDLSRHIDDYMDTSGHTRKNEVAILRSQIAHETEVIRHLMGEIITSETLPDLPLGKIVGFARQGLSLHDMEGFGVLAPETARNWIDDTIKDKAKQTTPQEYIEAGFTRHEALLLQTSGLGVEGGLLYREMNLKITPDTVVKHFRDELMVGPMKPLGKGRINKTYIARYELPDGETRGVFKPLKKPAPNFDRQIEFGWSALKTGVNPFDPQVAMRNLATCDVAAMLDFEVIVHTEIGVHDMGDGPQLGLIMSYAPGISGWDAPPSLFRSVSVRRELTKLQLVDHLTGQGDRSGRNYHIYKKEDGEFGVVGIDNDQCFGKDLWSPNGIAQGDTTEDHGFRGVKMPPVVDAEMARAIHALTAKDLKKRLAGKLSEQEIDAAVVRLARLKIHISNPMTCKIIDPEEWGSPEVTQLLLPTNSYIARDGGVLGQDDPRYYDFER